MLLIIYLVSEYGNINGVFLKVMWLAMIAFFSIMTLGGLWYLLSEWKNLSFKQRLYYAFAILLFL